MKSIHVERSTHANWNKRWKAGAAARTVIDGEAADGTGPRGK